MSIGHLTFSMNKPKNLFRRQAFATATSHNISDKNSFACSQSEELSEGMGYYREQLNTMIFVDETRTYLDCFTVIVSSFPCNGVGYLCNLKMLRVSGWQRAL